MRTVKAILIDPFACKVESVSLTGNTLKAYYEHLSHESMKVDLVTTAYPGVLKGHDALFVDDEGLLKDPQRFFLIASAHQPFAGKGLIVGADGSGASADAETSVDIVRMVVSFAEARDGRLLATRTPWEAPQ